MGFDGLFWIVFLRSLLLAFVSGGAGIAFFCLLLVWVLVWLYFFLVFDKRFYLRILSGWVGGARKESGFGESVGEVTFW